MSYKKGLDLSQHNGNIDFSKVKNAGIDFVILRLGWTGNKNNHTLDTKFLEYYRQAKAVGLKIGVYVYCYSSSVQTIASGAEWTINNLKNYGIELQKPVFIDMEDGSIRGLEKRVLTDITIKFCEICKSNGYDTGVYANLDWFKNCLYVNELLNYKIWLAEWTSKSSPSATFRVDLWQYTSNGSVDGISGRVDSNYCLNCVDSEQPITGKTEGDFEMKVYQNGSTPEPVYQDSACTNKIGSLNRYETCKCYGIVNDKAIVVYNVDGKNYKKVGFVKWLGGVK